MCESEEAINITRILEPEETAGLDKCSPGQQEEGLGTVPAHT